MLKMPTSGITKTFIVLGKEQTEKFANAIEDSYQESLHRKESLDFEITYLHGADEKVHGEEKEKIIMPTAAVVKGTDYGGC